MNTDAMGESMSIDNPHQVNAGVATQTTKAVLATAASFYQRRKYLAHPYPADTNTYALIQNGYTQTAR